MHVVPRDVTRPSYIKMASSSSSEDDEEERKIMAEIAECAAKDLTKAFVSKVEREHKNGDSKRAEKDYDQETQSSYLTQECKRHIAKKLSSYLDGFIEEETGYNFIKPKAKMSQVSGIHLFYSSRNKLLDMENDYCYLKENKAKTPKRIKQFYSSSESSDNEDDILKFQEAAVCGQSIIDQNWPSTDKYGMPRENSNKKKKKKRGKNGQNKDRDQDCGSGYEFYHLKNRWKEKCENGCRVTRKVHA